MTTATAQAHPNLAFIKYWGKHDNTLHLPMNGSISINLPTLYMRTRVNFQPVLVAKIDDFEPITFTKDNHIKI